MGKFFLNEKVQTDVYYRLRSVDEPKMHKHQILKRLNRNQCLINQYKREEV
jgi:hypothetical protein